MLFRAYDRLLLIYCVARRNGINDLSVAQDALEQILGDKDAEVQGWYQYSTGRMPEALARYADAPIEDLAFHPAHVRLAAMALAAGDTVAAADEFVLAAELAPTDAVVRYQCGCGLIVARRQAEAAEQLRAAVALEPWYAEPRLRLARLADDNELTTEAVTGYREFLARARPVTRSASRCSDGSQL